MKGRSLSPGGWVRRIVFLLALPFLLLAALWLVHPWVLPLRWVDPSTSAYILHRESQAAAAGTPFELRMSWIPLEEVAPPLVRAVLLAEDDRFREHRGVDLKALAEEVRYRGPIPPRPREAADREALREAWRYWRDNRDQVRGRSTITQQLARNLYLSPRRSYLRKGQELLLTWKLEAALPKDRILELYLNLAEWGPGVFGVEAAARHYFGVGAGELNTFQAASLAATLPHPLTANPAQNPGRMAWRRDLLLDRLLGRSTVPIPPVVEPPDLPDFPTDLIPPLPLPDTLVIPDSIPGGDSIPPPDSVPPGDSRPVPDSVAREDSSPRLDTGSPSPPRLRSAFGTGLQRLQPVGAGAAQGP